MKTTLLISMLASVLVSCATEVPPVSAGTAPAPAKIAKKAAAAKPKPYPLKTCLVSGDDLDEMDDRVSLVHEGQVFEFCCKPCVKKFNKNPGKYVKALEEATKG